MVLEKEIECVRMALSINNFDLTGSNEWLHPAHQNSMKEGKPLITIILGDNLDKSRLILNGTINTSSNTKVGILASARLAINISFNNHRTWKTYLRSGKYWDMRVNHCEVDEVVSV